MKAVITRGLQGSGKSTRAIAYLAQHPNTVRINKDSIRLQIFEERGEKPDWNKTRGMEGEVEKRQDEAIKQAFRDGKDVIVDNMHLSDRSYNKIAEFLSKVG